MCSSVQLQNLVSSNIFKFNIFEKRYVPTMLNFEAQLHEVEKDGHLLNLFQSYFI